MYTRIPSFSNLKVICNGSNMVPAQRARRIYLTVTHVTKIPLWKPSPDSEEIRQHLLTMLGSMLDDIGENWWRPKPDLEQAAIIQLGKFGERRAVQGLVRNLKHGFNWLSRTRAGTIMEGECDFVLLDAERGLLFVEAKGGSLLFDGRQWVRIVRGERACSTRTRSPRRSAAYTTSSAW